MTQLSSIQHDEEFKSIIEDSLKINKTSICPVNEQKVSPFNYLNSSFKALASIMEGNCNREELFETEKMLNSLIAKYKAKDANRLGKNIHGYDHVFISSNPQSSKKNGNIMGVGVINYIINVFRKRY